MLKNKDFLREFSEFIKNQRCSPSTCKNYLADLKHFLKFIEVKQKGILNQVQDDNNTLQLQDNTAQLFSDYKNFLTASPLSLTSINRRLSTLRKFGDYLKSTNQFSKNPAVHLQNLTPLDKKITRAKIQTNQTFQSLTKSVFSARPLFFALTLSASLVLALIVSLIIQQPLSSSAEGNATTTSSFTPSFRTITFQGQLDQNQQLALVSFKLWDQPSGGNQLYSTDYCFVKPDYHRSFSVIIGQDCGPRIPAELFNRYQKIYLETEVQGKKPVRTQILNTAPNFLAQAVEPPTTDLDDFLTNLYRQPTTDYRLPITSLDQNLKTEYYPSAESLQEGDVVSIISSNEITEEQNDQPITYNLIVKSSRPYDPNLLGIVYSPLSLTDQDNENQKLQPVALAGQVLVRVKGKIRLNDPLTSSETLGIAQKANQEGLILGRALENFTPLIEDQTGKILVSLNISWWKP